ncbi:hypothetical protein QBC44DRAFT_396018 [Cladorrhinum sp. PSN332]|nr:hypothetical protein QBC44DRAFT_396018 [Cladorrhinum sp. PSN332]
MDVSSPVKRRVLGVLDPNASSPKKIRHDLMKTFALSPPRSTAAATTTNVTAAVSPLRPRTATPMAATSARTPESEKKKRSFAASIGEASPSRATTSAEEGRLAKRSCFESSQQDKQPTPYAEDDDCVPSPAPSSVFDYSALDQSQETSTLTEPDIIPVALPQQAVSAPASAIQPPPPPPSSSRSRLTREQARQKVETLRLRLGLANYKVRTGQTDVPLEQLERRVYNRPAAASFSSSRRPTISFSPARPVPSFSSPSRPPPGFYYQHQHQYQPYHHHHQQQQQQQQMQRQHDEYLQQQARGGVQQLAAAAAALIPVPVPRSSVSERRQSRTSFQGQEEEQREPLAGQAEEEDEEEEEVVESELPRLPPPGAEPRAARRGVTEEDNYDDDEEEEEEREGVASGLLSLAKGGL